MRIGTRGSALALAQARWVAQRIEGDTELVAITTAGDRGEAPADKARWVSSLEQALLAGDIDLAVHSAKDVPAMLPAGLELVSILGREVPHDAICGASSLAALAPGAKVGTSSFRRAAQIKAIRADVEIVELRGNVDTRLAKLTMGAVDAVVLAAAGLSRLGRPYDGLLAELVPAAGQGALAVQARSDDEPTRRRVALALDDPATELAVRAERALTRALGASCHSAVGAYSGPGSGARRLTHVHLVGWIGLADGSEWIRDEIGGLPPEEAGEALAERMLAAGAGELLAA
jgi:hydroxymethylbilane synthase